MNENKKKYIWIIFSISLASFMGKLDTYIVNVSLPSISKELNVSTSEASLIVLYFLLFATSTMLIFGKIADKRGIKKIFISGYAIFTLSSFLCGISTNVIMLIIFRCIQGIGTSMLIVSVFAFIPKIIPEKHSGWAFGLISIAASLGIMLGAALGGIITGYLSWHWVFFLNVPIGIFAIITAKKVLPEDSDSTKHEKYIYDICGAATSFIAIFLVLFAFNSGKEIGWKSPLIISAFTGAFIFGILFIIAEKISKSPLLDLKIFKFKNFTLQILTAIMIYLFVSGNNFIMPFYLQSVKNLTPQSVGLILLIYSGIYLLLAPNMGKLSDKVYPGILCALGIFIAFCINIYFCLNIAKPGLYTTIIFLSVFGIALACFIPANNKLIMLSAPKDQKGSASGVYNLFTNLGMVLGVSIMETIFSEKLPYFKTNIFSLKLDPKILFAAFKNVYIFSALLFLVGLIISLYALYTKKLDFSNKEVIEKALQKDMI